MGHPCFKQPTLLGDSTVSFSSQRPAACITSCNLIQDLWDLSAELHRVRCSNFLSLCCRTIRPNSAVRSIYKASGCSDNPNHHVNFLEHVVVRITITHPRRGDLAIYLTSPSGTRSQLLANRYSDGLCPTGHPSYTDTRLFWGRKGQLLLTYTLRTN